MARAKSLSAEPVVEPSVEPEPVPQVSAPRLPVHRSEAIADLTAKAHALDAERRENQMKVDALNARNAAIGRELATIRYLVVEHAWDGLMLTDQPVY